MPLLFAEVTRDVFSQSGPKVIKLFSCSTQLSMKFKMLINIEIAKINGNFRFRSQKPAISDSVELSMNKVFSSPEPEAQR